MCEKPNQVAIMNEKKSTNRRNYNQTNIKENSNSMNATPHFYDNLSYENNDDFNDEMKNDGDFEQEDGTENSSKGVYEDEINDLKTNSGVL